MPDGKYFHIKSKLNGLVLDVQGASRAPGTPVITWPRKTGGAAGDGDNQLWYVDHLKGTINSKLSGLCLDLTDANVLVLAEFAKGRASQQWRLSADRIHKAADRDLVLDIAQAKTSQGARICAWAHHGQPNQQWTFEHTPATFFYVRSLMHGKVLDIKRRLAEPGTKALMMDREQTALANQLWYENSCGFLASKLTGFVLDSSKDGKVRLQPYESGNKNQRWVVSGDRVVLSSDPDTVLDIKEGQTKNGAKLVAYKWHGKDNQRWAVNKL